MARTKRTYIVNLKNEDETVTSVTLRDYCLKFGKVYNTILARIWRSRPEVEEGVTYLDEADPILADSWRRGSPGYGIAPKDEEQNRVRAPKHNTRAKGKYRNALR